MKYKPVINISATNYTGDWKAMIKDSEINFDHLKQIDKQAKEKGELLYRYFDEVVADGRVFYQVVSINENAGTCKIMLCNEICLDEYQHNYFGAGRVIDIEYAKQKIKQRDKLKEIFSKKS